MGLTGLFLVSTPAPLAVTSVLPGKGTSGIAGEHLLDLPCPGVEALEGQIVERPEFGPVDGCAGCRYVFGTDGSR